MATALQRVRLRGRGAGMNWHEVIDERSIELHGVIARELRANPEKLDLVVAWIQTRTRMRWRSGWRSSARGCGACWRRWRMKATKGSGCGRAARLRSSCHRMRGRGFSQSMKRADLEHILRACKGTTGETEFMLGYSKMDRTTEFKRIDQKELDELFL